MALTSGTSAGTPSDRLTNFLYTVQVGASGEEKKMQSVSGINQRTVNDSEWTNSEMEDFVSFPGRVEFDDVTMTYHPELSEGAKGKPGTPYPNFLFEVYFGNEVVARTRSVDGISVEANVIENDEGRKLTPMKQIGKRTYGDISLDQVYGKSTDKVFEEFAGRLADSGQSGGGIGQVKSVKFDNALENVQIKGMKRNRDETFLSLTSHGSWVSEFSTEDLDAESEDVLIKSITLQPSSIQVHRGLGNDVFSNWANKVLSSPDNYKKDLTVRAYDRGPGIAGDAVAEWKIYEAWVSTLELGTLDATNDDPWSVDATIVNEGQERIK